MSPPAGPSTSDSKSPSGGKTNLPASNVTGNKIAPSDEIKKPINANKKDESKKNHPKPEEPNKQRKLDAYVGFANLPNQVYRESVKKGFEFTLMVVGESGLGKSTLVNSMFLADIYSVEHPGPSLRVKKTVGVEKTQVALKENGVNLKLTVVDTPGFGDAVDNSNCWVPIVEYIESKYEEFLNAETRVTRRETPDTRVHCCLYFIAPTGHGLKPLDVEFMKRIHDKVNIVPIIAKADTMTPEECADFKEQIRSEIRKHKIQIYSFPDVGEEEDSKMHKILQAKVPFAVVGANALVENNGEIVRGRKYPWGVIEVENLAHCDFLALRNMVIRTHLQDMKDVTNNIHYENYRFRALAGFAVGDKPHKVLYKNPLARMEEEKRDHEIKMKKMEAEMEEVFETKVKEKRQKLEDTKKDFQRRHEQMRKNLEEEQRELNEKRRAFEAEKIAWEQETGFCAQEWRKNSETNPKMPLASTMGSNGGGDAGKGSRGLGSLLRRHTSVKSLQENITPLQPVIKHPENV